MEAKLRFPTLIGKKKKNTLRLVAMPLGKQQSKKMTTWMKFRQQMGADE